MGPADRRPLRGLNSSGRPSGFVGMRPAEGSGGSSRRRDTGRQHLSPLGSPELTLFHAAGGCRGVSCLSLRRIERKARLHEGYPVSRARRDLKPRLSGDEFQGGAERDPCSETVATRPAERVASALTLVRAVAAKLLGHRASGPFLTSTSTVRPRASVASPATATGADRSVGLATAPPGDGPETLGWTMPPPRPGDGCPKPRWRRHPRLVQQHGRNQPGGPLSAQPGKRFPPCDRSGRRQPPPRLARPPAAHLSRRA